MAVVIYDDNLHETLMELGRENPLAEKLAARFYWDSDTHDWQYYAESTQWRWVGLTDDPGVLRALPTSATESSWLGDDLSLHPKMSRVRAGRVIRAIATDKAGPTDALVEDLVNRLKAKHEAMAADREWKLISGDDIADAYNSDSTIYSCMADKPSHWFNIYTANPRQVKMLTRWSGPTLVGRALVWYADDGNVYVDRAYGSDAMRRAIANEARTRGWNKRTYDNYEPSDKNTFTKPDGTTDWCGVTITLDYALFRNYPYLDTMYYLDKSAKTLSNTYHGADLQLRSDQGGPNAMRECWSCDCAIDEDEDIYEVIGRHTYCEECADEHRCTDCGGYDETLEGGYCSSCIGNHRCKQCGGIYEDLNAASDDSTYHYCDSCVGEHTCDGCGDVFNAELNEDGRCSDCHVFAYTCIVCEEGFDEEPEYQAHLCDGCRRKRDHCDTCGLTIPTGQKMTFRHKAMARIAYLHRDHYWRDDVVRVSCKECEMERLTTMLTAGRLSRLTAGGQLTLIGG